jgi:hypothetical protein
METLKAKPLIIVFVHGFTGWTLCGATIWVGRKSTSLENALIIHAISVPIIFAIVSFVYFKTFNYTKPLQTALLFVSLVIFLDVFVVSLLIEKSFEMFASVLGTWLPLFLIFVSTYLTGLFARGRNETEIIT